MKNFNQKDIDENMEKLDEKFEKITSNPIVSKYSNYIMLYCQMLRDYFSGKYRKVSVGSIAAVICTLMYFIMPIDLIPDFIPVIGFLDDAAILALCLKITRSDLEEYKKNGKKLSI